MRELFLALLAGAGFSAGSITFAEDTPLRAETFDYASSVDGVKPLHVDVAFVPDGKPKPLLAVMHGYGGNRKNVAKDLPDFAAKGIFALAPDMRGSGDSAGKFDSGGVEVHDIVDAVLACLKKYPGEIDPRNLNVVGFSGGGGNAIACAVRFPDLFQTCVSFFGISDYAAWHRSGGRPDCASRMKNALGGTPDDLPAVYEARDYNAAAGNIQAGRLHLVWDEQEKQCPPAMTEQFAERHRKAGLDRVAVHVSKTTDKERYIHGYRAGRPAMLAADKLYLPEILAPKAASPKLPAKGRLVVPGYLVSRHFSVWIEDGQKGQVTVEYDLGAKPPALKVVENARNLKVRLETATPLAALP